MVKLINNCTHHTITEDGTVTNTKTNNVKTQWIGANGYYHVDIHENGISTKVAVHRLLALHYLPNPLNKRTVNHIDGNKLNNKLDNLEWATDSENVSHAHSIGLHPDTRKFSTEDYTAFLHQVLSGKSITDLAKELNTGLSQLSIHIRRIAKALDLESSLNTELKIQKNARAVTKGLNSRCNLTLHMKDLSTNETLRIFSSITEAKNYLQVKSSGPISNVLAGRQKSAYGYFWVSS